MSYHPIELEYEFEPDEGESVFYTISAMIDYGSPPNRQGHIDYWDDGEPGEVDDVEIFSDKGVKIEYDDFVRQTGVSIRKLQDWVWKRAEKYNR